jgi:hypothetical protein
MGVFQYPPGGDIGDRDPMLARDLIGRLENALIAAPASGGLDEPEILGSTPVLDRFGFRLADPAFGEEAAAKGAVGKQVDTMLLAGLRQMPRGAAIDQRKRYLVGNQRNAFGQCEIEMGGIEIGDADFADQSLPA